MTTRLEQLKELYKYAIEEGRGTGYEARCMSAAFDALPALLAVVDAAKYGPCRHSSDHTPDNCPLCKALAELEKEV